jgi:hypothetical protein
LADRGILKQMKQRVHHIHWHYQVTAGLNLFNNLRHMGFRAIDAFADVDAHSSSDN